jgi:methylglyoxal synthase
MAKVSIALIAHDSKKEDMVMLVRTLQMELAGVRLVATRDTGSIVQGRTGLDVDILQSGPQGGDQQIGALVASGALDAVVFLCDPLTAQSYEPQAGPLLRVCNVHNVPIATNVASAEALLHFVLQHEYCPGLSTPPTAEAVRDMSLVR